MRSPSRAVFLTGAACGALFAALLAAQIRGRPASNRGDPLPPMRAPRGAGLPAGDGEQCRYTFTWQGMPAATLQVRYAIAVQDGRPCMEISYEGQTSALIDWAWSYRLTGRTLIDPETLLPRRCEVTSVEGDRRKVTRTAFDRREGLAHVETWKPDRDRRKREAVPVRNEVDAAGAMLLLRTARNGGVVRVLSGDDTLELAARPGRRGPVRVPAGEFNAVQWSLAVRAAAPAREAQRYRGLRLWLSEDGRVPVRLEADVLIGRVTAELVGHQEGD